MNGLQTLEKMFKSLGENKTTMQYHYTPINMTTTEPGKDTEQ